MARILHTQEPAAPWRAGARSPAAAAAEGPAVAPAAGAAPALGIGAVEFMGGRRWFKTVPQSRAEIHGALVKGVPYAILVNLVDHLTALSADEVAEAVGISARTLRRQKEQPAKLMPPDLASRTWQLAEILAQASAVFGGREAAERWMAHPALGLDGARPIDLLRTLQGAELVTEFLGRLEHGVYS
ncbi:antitoxin Xre/MbcA/ParS toxin-binding domain-containing protein [Ideonella sp. DXS22W]|uniref:Antitoxin Xre/MbcA/ParS toxin-binding domain-containing protein n=1 Tax=Pseudaquabacterium inlustre TaxID=2984192 RepID=A0ABU9CGG2_9BURK